MERQTNLHLPDDTPKSFRSSVHDVTLLFYKHINNLKEGGSLLAYNVKRSRDNGWQNVSIPYHDALAVISQIDDSSGEISDIFEGTKQAAILADKNRAIAEEVYRHPLERTFEKFVKGDIQEEELKAAINKTFSVKNPFEV